MNVTFKGVPLQGRGLHAQTGDEVIQHQPHEVFGLAGSTLIVGADSGEDVEVLFELTGFVSGDALVNYVTALKGLRGTPGTLIVAGTFTRTWFNTSLISLARIEHDGQTGPLANNPHLPSAPWTDHLLLKFRRLA